MSNPTKILCIVAKYNHHITDRLLAAAKLQAKESNCHLEVNYVPGAVELPLAAQRAARSQQYDAVIVYGAVIFGETDHYYYVCEMVSQGCMRVMLDESFPVIFGVLTVKTLEQAIARVDGTTADMGKETVLAALDVVNKHDN